jgi:hypothetical protein
MGAQSVSPVMAFAGMQHSRQLHWDEWLVSSTWLH